MSTDTHKQTSLAQFVEREVISCETLLIEDLLGDGKLSIEDIENFYPEWQHIADSDCDHCGEKRSINNLGYCKDCWDSEGLRYDWPQEIYEWWKCSEWLTRQLERRGEPILKTDYGDYWGRTCTGQAIALDQVIKDIYDGRR
jgi:hypothetical protein